MNKVFTIGYSNLTTERFSELIQSYGITAIADVRSSPYSKMFPIYNKENMPAWLKKIAVRYVYLGNELGPRSTNDSLYKNDQIQFDLLSNTELFQKGINRLINGSKENKIAIMCAEKDPMTCHRSLLVAHYGKDENIEFSHIHQNGSLESHDDMLDRAMRQYKIIPDMLTDQEACRENAHRMLCSDYAYRKIQITKKPTGYQP